MLSFEGLAATTLIVISFYKYCILKEPTHFIQTSAHVYTFWNVHAHLLVCVQDTVFACNCYFGQIFGVCYKSHELTVWLLMLWLPAINIFPRHRRLDRSNVCHQFVCDCREWKQFTRLWTTFSLYAFFILFTIIGKLCSAYRAMQIYSKQCNINLKYIIDTFWIVISFSRLALPSPAYCKKSVFYKIYMPWYDH